MARGLGLGLGFKRPQRRAFRQAVRRGELPNFFSENPTAQALFQQRLEGQGTNQQQNRALRFAQRGGFPLPNLDGSRPPDPGNGSTTPRYGVDPNEMAGGQTVGNPTFATVSDRYNAGVDPSYNALDEYLRSTTNRLTGDDSLQRYNPNFQQEMMLAGDTGDTPSFEEQFGRYKDISARELERSIAGLNELYGSRGARYSADIGREQETMRRNATTDLAAQAAEVQRKLNEDRARENEQRIAYNNYLTGREQMRAGANADWNNAVIGRGQVEVGLAGAQANAAARRQQVRDEAAQRAWQSYLLSQAPSPMAEAMLNYGSSFPLPGQIVY